MTRRKEMLMIRWLRKHVARLLRTAPSPDQLRPRWIASPGTLSVLEEPETIIPLAESRRRRPGHPIPGIQIAELDGDALTVSGAELAELVTVDEENPGDMMEPIGLRSHEPIELTGTWDPTPVSEEELDAQLLADPNYPLCDECARPATKIVADMRETPPVDGFRNFQPTGDVRRGCSDHPVESRTIELDHNDPASWGID